MDFFKLSYRHLGTAIDVACRGKKAMAVIMGDNDYFWVVTLAVAEKLHKAGYEYAY